jgi:hypothetical protein
MRSENESDVMLSGLKRKRDLAATVAKLTDGNKTSKEDVRDSAAMLARSKEDIYGIHDRLDAIVRRGMTTSIREAMVLLEIEMSKDMYSTETVSNDTIKRHFFIFCERYCSVCNS